ncbi:FlgO family outer membrane protein [Desulfovibrio sp. ZJ200]|uniref:FlgO family outer membrane protein n=1 Tax=Desulfovibrio sp. ZJ200 TaxID=2709792 RepID=UPI0013ED71A6|nr:FlgO family outer membrane protein [Desulfovibrio sp. ZJ200]
MSRFIVVILVFAALLFPLTAAAIGTVPKAANSIAEQLDAQLMMRYAGNDPDIDKKQSAALARARIMIMGTTPANLNNLEKSSPLGRQMTEEISRWLINAGYRYQELRKGRYIRFDRRTGEFILTRNVRKLARTVGTSQAVLAGTYVVSSEQVRFSISLLHTTSNEVLAKGTATVPITDDLLPLLEDPLPGSGYMPTVYTRLQ